MKLIHLSDLHLGKRVNGFSMLEDQRYILEQILHIADDEEPYGVMIAGDVYDKSEPSADAVSLLDDFLYELVRRRLKVFMISGNHDSADRLSCNHRLLYKDGVFISPRYDDLERADQTQTRETGQDEVAVNFIGTVCRVSCIDEYGPVYFYLLPFIKPFHVRRVFPEEEIHSYTDALRTAVENLEMDHAQRNVLLAHQFVTGAQRCESEEVYVGGLEDVDASVFDGIDYVALGHIHGPQNAGRETVRYCGTPLKYSFSEVGHEKSVTVVELREKGNIQLRYVPLVPQRDMVTLRGSFEELARKNIRENQERDYTRITLTDEDDIPDAAARLRQYYPCLMRLDYDNQRTHAGGIADADERAVQMQPMELLELFYEEQNGQKMSDAQRAFAKELIEKIWEGDGS